MLMAGIDGIKNKIHPGDAWTRTSMTCRRKKARPSRPWPRARSGAGSLDADRSFLTEGGVFTDEMIDAYIELKSEDIERLRMTTHPVEFDMYYSC